MDKTKISFLRYILEAYDGVAVLTTIDKTKGIVVLRTSPGFQDEVEIIISDLTEAISIQPYEIEEN